MSSALPTSQPSTAALWTGRVLSTLPVLLLLFSAFMKLSQNPQAVKGFSDMGFPDGVLIPIGIAELGSTVLYAIPQTAVLGAILLTGYLGGATATHVHAGDPLWFPPVIFGVVLWLGLALRDPRLWQLIPWRTNS